MVRGVQPRQPGSQRGADAPRDEKNADAILVSQVVTQRDVHKDNSRQFIEAAKDAGIHGKMLLLLGGPRVDHKLALELGFDAGFGPGTKPSDVANYIVHSAAASSWARSRSGSTTRESPSERRSKVTLRLRMSTPRRALRRQPGRRRAHARRCSATWPPSCSSGTTATRGCSAPTTRSSSSRPCYAGDYIEAEGEIVEVGNTSREDALRGAQGDRAATGRQRLGGRGARTRRSSCAARAAPA